MRRRITHLTPHDLEQQAWIIRVSLLTASEEEILPDKVADNSIRSPQ